MEKSRQLQGYIKKTSFLNSALVTISLIWFVYSVVELINFIADANDGVLEKYYNLNPILGQSTASLTIIVASLFVVVSFVLTIILLVKGIRLDKHIVIGKGTYVVAIAISLASIFYFLGYNALLKGVMPDLKSIIFIVLSLIALIVSMLIVMYLVKADSFLSDEVFEEVIEEDDFSVEPRDNRYNQDPNQFDAVVNNHEELSEEAERKLTSQPINSNPETNVEPSNGFASGDTISVDLEELKRQMKEENFVAAVLNQKENKDTFENNKVSTDNEITSNEDFDLSKSSTSTDSFEKPVSNFAAMVSQKEATPETNVTKNFSEIPMENNVEDAKKVINPTVFEDYTTRIERKVLSMPGDDSKVIVITKEYKNDKLVNESSEIKLKSEL